MSLASKVIALLRKFRPVQAGPSDLTPHETRLLKLLSEGHNYKTAAVRLGVNVNTISFHINPCSRRRRGELQHRQQVYAKLHVHSKSEAIAKALRAGIIR